MKTPAFRSFRVDGGRFENEASQKAMTSCHWSLTEFFRKHVFEMTGECCVLAFSSVVWTENNSRVFKVNPAVFPDSSSVVWLISYLANVMLSDLLFLRFYLDFLPPCYE